MRSLGTLFRKFDSYNGDRLINRAEFYVGLRELGVSLKKVESDVRIKADSGYFKLVNIDSDLVLDAFGPS